MTRQAEVFDALLKIGDREFSVFAKMYEDGHLSDKESYLREVIEAMLALAED